MLIPSNWLWSLSFHFRLPISDETTPGRRVNDECLLIITLNDADACEYSARNDGSPPASRTKRVWCSQARNYGTVLLQAQGILRLGLWLSVTVATNLMCRTQGDGGVPQDRISSADPGYSATPEVCIKLASQGRTSDFEKVIKTANLV